MKLQKYDNFLLENLEFGVNTNFVEYRKILYKNSKTIILQKLENDLIELFSNNLEILDYYLEIDIIYIKVKSKHHYLLYRFFGDYMIIDQYPALEVILDEKNGHNFRTCLTDGISLTTIKEVLDFTKKLDQEPEAYYVEQTTHKKLKFKKVLTLKEFKQQLLQQRNNIKNVIYFYVEGKYYRASDGGHNITQMYV